MAAENTTPKKKRGSYNKDLKSVLDIWNVLAAYSSEERPLDLDSIYRYLNPRFKDKKQERRRQLAADKKSAQTAAAPAEPDFTEDEEAVISPQTTERYLKNQADLFNTLFPQTVLRYPGTPAVSHTYGYAGSLHVVLENPSGEKLWSGQMTALLQMNSVNPIPYSTLSRKLPKLMREYEKAGDYKQEIPLSLAGVVANPNAGGVNQSVYIPATMADPDARKHKKYYLQSILSDSEWRILSDLIRVYPHISEQATEKYLSALQRIAPGVKNLAETRYAHKGHNALQFQHLEQLDRAIREKNKVSVDYGKYVLHFDRKSWQPRLEHGNTLMVDPYAMMWSNGYYYLICRSDKLLLNLRVDRILKVINTTMPFDATPDFDPYEYRDRSPVMYPGKPELISLRCHLSMLSTLQDIFGSAITSYSRPEDDFANVTLKASLPGTRLFALQYADKVEVLLPAQLREDVKNTLRAAAEKYE